MARTSAIGLDIGTSGVRAAQLSFAKSGLVLEKFAHAPLPAGAVRDGEVVGRATLEEARARHRASVAELPRSVAMMSAGEPVIPTVHLGA